MKGRYSIRGCNNVLQVAMILLNATSLVVMGFLSDTIRQRTMTTTPPIHLGSFMDNELLLVHPSSLLLSSTASPLEESDSSSSNSGSSNVWMKELRARQIEFGRELQDNEDRWKSADCASGVKVILPDWIRRLDVDYPLVACGSASGKIYVANLKTGQLSAESPPTTATGTIEDLHNDIDDDEELKDLEDHYEKLYGMYDGGGTVAIALNGDLIAEANRKGGIHLWRLDSTSNRLVSQGKMLAFKDVLVTCLHLDDEYLWAATADGQLQAFALENEMPLALQTVPELKWKFNSMVNSLSISQDINCGVITTSDGSVQLISIEDDNGPLCTFYPPWDHCKSEMSVHALSAVLVAHGYENELGVQPYSIAVGGNDGNVYLQPLEVDEDGEVDTYKPFAGRIKKLKPFHTGAVKCLTVPRPGLVVSAAQDGSVRVWNVDDGKCLYQFVGYKVWLGSLWTDGLRIVSDGSDNSIVVHDFEKTKTDRD